MSKMAELDSRIRGSELFKAMRESGNYTGDDEVVETIFGMMQEVENGADPEEVLLENGIDPDYVLDLLI